jgi:glycine cleavage system H protein
MSATHIPENLAYSEEHEWISQDNEIFTVGITDYAQAELGDIVFVELPEVGDYLKQGQTFGTVEAVKTVSDLYAPASGEVVEVNRTLEENAEQVNSDPYGVGWLIKIRPEDETELNLLLSPDDYAKLIAGL